MKPLKVALIVPDDTYTCNNDGQFRISDLKQACRAKKVDLVVFPESYECVPVAESQNTVTGRDLTLTVTVHIALKSDPSTITQSTWSTT